MQSSQAFSQIKSSADIPLNLVQTPGKAGQGRRLTWLGRACIGGSAPGEYCTMEAAVLPAALSPGAAEPDRA